jgi:hypothetical protein
MPAPSHCVGPAWPPALEAYDYLSKLYWRDWAWEGLRRNRAYQADALACVSSATTERRFRGGGLLSTMHDASPSQLWGLCTFANPALTALQAHHVWLPEVGMSVFPAAATPVQASAPSDASIFFPALTCLEQIMIDARGRQHVILRGNEAALQLTIEGNAIVDEPWTSPFWCVALLQSMRPWSIFRHFAASFLLHRPCRHRRAGHRRPASCVMHS